MNNHKLGTEIPPKCAYCLHCITTGDAETLLCKYKGIASPEGSCKKFVYDPLKRVPQRPAPLPEFNPDDFKL